MNLIEFLYPEEISYKSIQFIVASSKKQVFGWFPGRKGDEKLYFHQSSFSQGSEGFNRILNTGLVGYTGRVYESYKIPMQAQTYYLCWVAIDLDQKDQKKLELTSPQTIENISREIPECSIRTSKSGRGLHLIFRMNPVKVSPLFNLTFSIKKTLQPYVYKLNSLGIKVCQANGGVFFLIGGRQRFIKISQERIDLEIIKTSSVNGIMTPGGILPPSQLNEVGKDLLRRFNEQGEYLTGFPLELGIYVKSWYETLKDTPFFFETKSPMSPGKRAHNNGKMFINGNSLSIYTSADNKIVKSIPIIG